METWLEVSLAEERELSLTELSAEDSTAEDSGEAALSWEELFPFPLQAARSRSITRDKKKLRVRFIVFHLFQFLKVSVIAKEPFPLAPSIKQGRLPQKSLLVRNHKVSGYS